jgi:hypothetical protein
LARTLLNVVVSFSGLVAYLHMYSASAACMHHLNRA